MLERVPAPELSATTAMAAICQERQLSAEPLWFAVMCRQILGPNAAKELHFILGSSDRTCRAWASGDSIPLATVLAVLLRTEHGDDILTYIMAGTQAVWWSQLQRDRGQAAAARAFVAGMQSL